MHIHPPSRRRHKTASPSLPALAAFTLLTGAVSLPAHAGAGGGFDGAGLTGQYYNNPAFSGSPTFTRADQRLDFGTSCTLPPAGVGTSGEPGYGSVGSTAWSAVWKGTLTPAFTETYQFASFAHDKVLIKLKPTGAAAWTTVINQTANTNVDNTGQLAMLSGRRYDIEVDFAHGSGPWGLNLRWSSPSTPPEVIDTLNNTGYNCNDKTAMFADLIKGARNTWQPASGSTAPPMDSNGWPLADASYVFQESLNQGLDVDPLMRGAVSFSFTGSAAVSVTGNCGSVQSHYTASTNTTTGSFQIFNNGWNASNINLRSTQRNDGTGRAGFTNLRVWRPTSPDAATTYPAGSVFIQPMRDAMAHFSVLRFQKVADQQKLWSDRTLPAYFNQNGGAVTQPYYGNGQASNDGTAWEYDVMLCNETGRDMMISIPTVADGVTPADTGSYIVNLANLLKYGSDGVNPYTGPAGSDTSNPQPASGPVFAPLNPNLRVYLELGNELWNWGGPFWTDWNNINALVTADKTANNTDFKALNYDNVNDVNVWRLRKAIQRMIEISNIFRSVWGDAAMPGTSADPHVRPLYEWQYADANGTADIPLSFADNFYNNADGVAHVSTPHPVSYFLWGGGGATYYGGDNGNGLTTALPDGAFALPKLAATGYQQNPTGGSWNFTGTAGIARVGTAAPDIPPAYSGSQVGYITDKGSLTVTVTIPATQTSNLYGVSFKAVNRTKTGAAAADTENIRVFLDGATDITARTFSQGNGYTPPGYDPQNPWIARNVFWSNSEYYFTRSFTAAPGSSHTITIRGMGDISTPTNTNQTTFLGEVRLTSVDAIYSGGIPAGGDAAGQPTGSDYLATLTTEANWARTYGLQDLAYEGGWSLGGDDGGSWIQNLAKYGDARTETAQAKSLSEFLGAGGGISVLGTYEQWPDWSDYQAQQGLINVTQYPIVQAVDAAAAVIPTPPTNGSSLPNVLTPSFATLSLNASNGTISKTGGWISWNVVSKTTQAYTITVAASGTGTYHLLLDDSFRIARSASVTLTAGLHTLRVQSSGGSVTVTSVTAAIASAPKAPVLAGADGDGSANLTWTAVTGASSYIISWGTASRKYTGTISAGSATTYTLTGLRNLQAYYFAVSAINAAGASLPSNEKRIVPMADNQLGSLVVFGFAGYSGNEASAAPVQATSRLTATSLTRGTGLVPTTYLTIAANTFGSEASGNVYGADLASAITKNQYYQFTITPVAGKKLSLTSLVFEPYFQNAGAATDPRGAGIAYSTDGTHFSAGIAASGKAATSASPFTVTLSGIAALQSAASPITLRIYLFGNGAYEFTGIGGSAGGNDIVLTGEFGS